MDTIPLADITNSIEQYNTPSFDWDVAVPFASLPISLGSGGISSVGGGSVVSWSFSGQVPINNAIAWRRCGVLLTRL